MSELIAEFKAFEIELLELQIEIMKLRSKRNMRFFKLNFKKEVKI